MRHILDSLKESRAALEGFMADPAGLAGLSAMATILTATFRSGGQVIACGNGGSACDAIHFAEEFTGRYRKDRRPLPAISLADGAHLTCVANDYGFEEVFARGVAAYGRPGDSLLAISTSGNSPNVIKAVETAKQKGMSVLLLLGREGGRLRDQGSAQIIVAGSTTDRIQEVHMIALHILIESVERELFPENYA
jgi:D-sedoheptulose 7-phosphate isomerase